MEYGDDKVAHEMLHAKGISHCHGERTEHSHFGDALFEDIDGEYSGQNENLSEEDNDGEFLEHTHTHDGACGHTHTHVGMNHTHTHDPEDIKKIIVRMAKIIGHMEAVKRMVEEGEDCPDVIIQLAAIKAAVNSVGRLMIKEHMEHCIVDAIEESDDDALQKLNEAIDRFIK